MGRTDSGVTKLLHKKCFMTEKRLSIGFDSPVENNDESPHNPTPVREGNVEFAESEVKTIARETGRAYNGFIDIYLEEGAADNKQEKINQLLESLPESMKKLYGKALATFNEELQLNNTILEKYRGAEAEGLLRAVMQYGGKTEEEMAEVFNNLHHTKYVEPTKGVPIIEADNEFFNTLLQNGVAPEGGHAVHFAADRQDASFMLMRKSKPGTPEADSHAKNKWTRHEFHHFIWNFLTRSGFLREPKDNNPQFNEAFEHFRDELVAYVIQESGIQERDVAGALAYTTDKEIIKVATDTRNFVSLCIQLGRQKGMKWEHFVYPGMVSVNFEDVKEKYAAAVKVEKKLNRDTLETLYDFWLVNRDDKSLTDFIAQKQVEIPESHLQEMALQKLLSSDLATLGRLNDELGKIEKFATALQVVPFDRKLALSTIAKARLPLPPESLEVVLNAPVEATANLPLGKSGKELLTTVISIWGITDEKKRAFYKDLIHSSPDLLKQFKEILPEIISKGEISYRAEYKANDEARAQRINQEVEQRKKLLADLEAARENEKFSSPQYKKLVEVAGEETALEIYKNFRTVGCGGVQRQ